MAILKRDLQAVKKDIKALEKKMEKLLNAYGKSPKPKTASKAKRKVVKPKTKRAVTVKKATPRKKTAKATATEQILKIIKRSRKGVDVPTLKTKTGFEDKKVRNIIFRASKEGKIKKVGRGIYVGA
jgi:predicted metalloendopeptidase